MKNGCKIPLVSIVLPCRNEEQFIRKCLDSIIAQDYPRNRFEVLIVDGMSEDRTRVIIRDYTKKYSFIRILDNPKIITPCALNLGINKAGGELILRMDAHNKYDKEYISKCIEYMDNFKADSVGGIIIPIPRDNSLMGKIICIIISHPFGVGSSFHKIGTTTPRWVDTAFGVCYKKEIFQKIGFFNEKLIRGQDMEFSIRLKKGGIKTLLAPDIISYYYTRSGLKQFIKHNFINGMWAILPFKYTNVIPVSLRHLVPLIFVLSLMCSGLSAFFTLGGLLVFLIIAGVYSLCNLYFSFQIAIKERDFKLLLLMPLTFFTFHFSYGLGSVWGLLKLVISMKDV